MRALRNVCKINWIERKEGRLKEDVSKDSVVRNV